ncbi:glycosyl hydrolase family 47 [Teladorsagia circumcincta]|uniref:alpha-1,2-Mannosidase n=1 Tax=Teladorsagia circumcincta TaxID=45464 RepID=A0A2G9TQI5_TELCI|nr:glycosyl hydrolase family 47 [Teladorsagia circumcincta]
MVTKDYVGSQLHWIYRSIAVSQHNLRRFASFSLHRQGQLGSLGALGDSFYEYLLKSWLQSGKTDAQAKRMYWEANEAIQKNMIFKSKTGLTYVAELRNGLPEHKMSHLACFVVGMFALQAANEDDVRKRMYRDWVWDAVEAIDKYCRVDAGFAGLQNVYDPKQGYDNVQQSFFLAETLKYAYLTFSDKIPLDRWVFNTEAHPLPVMGEIRSSSKLEQKRQKL